MNILLINDIHELEIAKFMYSFYHRMLPEILITTSNLEILNIHSIADLLHQMAITWEELLRRVGSCSGIYAGVKIWNKIPLKIKKLSKHTFCRQIKKSLIGKY